MQKVIKFVEYSKLFIEIVITNIVIEKGLSKNVLKAIYKNSIRNINLIDKFQLF